MSTTTVYPNAGTGTEPFDGHYVKTSTGGALTEANWAEAHDATAADSVQDTDTTFLARVDIDGGNNYTIHRGICGFDTSAIADTDTIDSATLSVGFGGSKNDNEADAQSYIALVDANPGTTTAAATADYDLVGDAIDNPTKMASDITISSWSTAAYNVYTLNSSGLANINKTGTSWFGIREGHDVEDSKPDVVAGDSVVRPASADTSGTSNDPKLVVTHSAAAGGFMTTGRYW